MGIDAALKSYKLGLEDLIGAGTAVAVHRPSYGSSSLSRSHRIDRRSYPTTLFSSKSRRV
jgi:hypothetical protein